jgi:hypothetical protein
MTADLAKVSRRRRSGERVDLHFLNRHDPETLNQRQQT